MAPYGNVVLGAGLSTNWLRFSWKLPGGYFGTLSFTALLCCRFLLCCEAVSGGSGAVWFLCLGIGL